MSNIDANRIYLSECSGFNLNRLHNNPIIAPINRGDVPMYSTTELKSVIVDPSSERNKEKLVDVTAYGIKSVAYYKYCAANNPTYNSNIDGAPDIIYAREGVCQQLNKANNILSPLGLELVVFDAHRSPATQKKLYMYFLGIAYQKGYKGDDAENYAAQYCSNPKGFDKNNPKTWTMHSTGAALDVYLMDKKTGRIVDMGEGYFDNPAPVTNTLYYEDMAETKTLTPEQQDALLARRILFNTMAAVGLDNYGSECYHFEYKGLINAKVQTVKGVQTNAEYGYIPSPLDEGKIKIISSLLHAKSKEKES